ncbi:secretin N-terminal domain-containing protein [Uliginosibacterium sp. H3]|uniref:Secretin N-terminal domain-containing protein n=1 Tax=Uliginosibacterium silvisoli TaxID=3114758 RepID=A0ABU6K4C4_9RHOO|nr:secretin N-terminal domain-containing protein [Uliginosibacterium sp. H3]
MALLICAQLAACTTPPPARSESTARLIEAGGPEATLAVAAEAMQADPTNKEARLIYFRTRDQQVAQALTAADRARNAGNADEAKRQANMAQRMDPDNQRVQLMQRALSEDTRRADRLRDAENLFQKRQLAEAETIARGLLADNPGNPAVRNLLRRIDDAQGSAVPDAPVLKSNIAKPITLEFRDTPLRSVFEAISRTAGINFVFDKDVRADGKVTVFVRNTNIDEVIRMVLTTNGLERKMLNENSMLIYPAIAAKQRDYQELVTRTFYLANTDAKQAQALIKSVVKTRDTFIDEKLNLLIIKDTPDAVRMAERLVQQLDVPDPEVMLEVEVLEVLRSRLIGIGVQFPEQVGFGLLQPTTQSVVTTTTGTTQSTNLGGQLQQGYVNLNHASAMVPFVSNPALLLNLKDQDGSSNILANPRIRVRNREKAKIHIGDKLPVFTTTSTANVGVSASVNYLDVGLKLDVEPTIHLDDDVEIKVGLEVSSVTKEVVGPQNSLAYQIGTRNTNTTLRLRDGETQVLAGLISDEERSTGQHVPGIGRLPMLGHLFSNSNNSNTKTEIILLITPRVVRNISPTALSRTSMAAGTDASVGTAPMRVTTPTPPRSLDVRGSGNAGQAAAPPAPPPPPPSSPVPNEGMGATLTLAGPSRIAPGQEFSVTVSASAESAIRVAETTVSWDSTLFEQVGVPASGGSATLSLAPSGNSASAQLRLRAKIDGNGDGMIEVSAARVSASADDVSTNNPQPLAIKVGR